jgi:hypothetical protein
MESVATLMISHLIGAVIVFSASAIIEKKLGHETFLGYGLDYLLGLPFIVLWTVITYVELALLLSFEVNPFDKLTSLGLSTNIIIGFSAGCIHIFIMLLISAIDLQITFGGKTYGNRFELLFNASILFLKVFGGITLLYLVALHLAH